MQLPEKNDDPVNYVIVEMMINSPLLPGSGSVLGKAALHIHDIIRVGLFIYMGFSNICRSTF